MLWKQTNAMDERIRYVVRAEQAGKRLGERSDEFGVHRATGWRWRRRLQEAGGTIEYLAERSRRPHRSPRHRDVAPPQRRSGLSACFGDAGSQIRARKRVGLRIRFIGRSGGAEPIAG